MVVQVVEVVELELMEDTHSMLVEVEGTGMEAEWGIAVEAVGVV